MSTEPTPDEIAFAKKWSAAQSPAVFVDDRKNYHSRWELFYLPNWLDELDVERFNTADAAWSALAIAIRPIRESLAGVIAEDERAWCIEVCEEIGVTGSASDGAEHIRRAAAIRAHK